MSGRTYTIEQRAARLARQRKWRAANPHKVAIYRKSYAERHPERIRAKANRYYARHRILRMAESRLRHALNREKLNAQCRDRYAKNRAARRAYAIARYKRLKIEYITRAKRWIAFNRELHNSYTRKTCRQATKELRLWYVRHKARRTGASIKQHRQTIQLWRTKHTFKAMATAAVLSSAAAPQQ